MTADLPGHPADAGTRFVERRAVPRFHMIAEIEVFEPISKVRVKSYTAEIGARGCYVRVSNPLEKNTVIQIRIVRNRDTFSTWGRVVHVHERLGMGVAFFKPEPAEEKILESWLGEIRANQAAHVPHQVEKK